MRVALYEPHPRTCGVTKWAFELARGFRALGHHADVVTFTKSGRRRAVRAQKSGGPRWGWRWWPDEPDVTRRWTEAPDVLDGYDLIVWAEPKCNPIDFDAQKGGYEPEYVTALRASKTPWVTALHDAKAYGQSVAPFLDLAVGVPSFTGLAIECRPGSYRSGEWALAGHVTRLQPWPWLPYEARGRAPDVERFYTVALGGRLTTTKGYQTLVNVADELPADWQVRLFGSESGGMGPSVSYKIYEALVRHGGWTGERHDPEKIATGYHSEKDAAINNVAGVNNGVPWWAEKDGHVIRFTGAYLDALVEWTRCSIACQLTTDDIVTTYEYTSLEALDAGCVLIVPDYYRRDMGAVDYPGVRYLQEFSRGASLGSRGITWDDDTARKELVGTILGAVDAVREGLHDPGPQRAALEAYNSPRHLAAKILEVL